MQFFEINNIEKKNKKHIYQEYILYYIIFLFFNLYRVQEKNYTTTLDYSNAKYDNNRNIISLRMLPLYQSAQAKQAVPNNTHYYKFGAQRPLIPHSTLNYRLSHKLKKYFKNSN